MLVGIIHLRVPESLVDRVAHSAMDFVHEQIDCTGAVLATAATVPVAAAAARRGNVVLRPCETQN